ncbi:MAG: 1-deoxy-D-xylulose-5-phosphate reductoisomerase [Defluviitaleaceae bacterium]|nr:1-deoxy-D-xylulose-5-phosphate reductoisomerase [Defluviitaleaceae bacterium]
MRIVILGSTGSIGTQTLEVVRGLGNIEVAALTAHSNIDLLEQQIAEFRPKVAAVYDEAAALELARRVGPVCEVLSGPDGIVAVAENGDGLVVNALVGSAGVLPTIAAINAGCNIALANKETLVCAGEIIMPLAKAKGVAILPVDSEHSAIFQCLQGNGDNKPHKIYLTASGGPFRGYTLSQLEKVTVEDALRHPNWSMGRKVTIDSATMMNKGLEVIEAGWLFDAAAEEIEVLVHPQSVVHSMVEFADGQIVAQLGPPDMRLPIQYALTYPHRASNTFSRLNFAKSNTLTFETPNFEAFPCLRLAYEAYKAGGMLPNVLNAANEVALEMFLAKKISFLDIAKIIDGTISAYTCEYNGNNAIDIDGILEVEKWARGMALKAVRGKPR